ncbi:hypothetical protein HU200_050432 [Digitaria exilis]|uniref:Uncharacterized protein n=1 Tax=Digitaria exilis TaxID=1010633 RepID=A0A835E7M8_9POAL|nr:hypothetical protein HU200_050432 [Digitaria exilis]
MAVFIIQKGRRRSGSFCLQRGSHPSSRILETDSISLLVGATHEKRAKWSST